jgi:hypothetical protein
LLAWHHVCVDWHFTPHNMNERLCDLSAFLRQHPWPSVRFDTRFVANSGLHALIRLVLQDWWQHHHRLVMAWSINTTISGYVQ